MTTIKFPTGDADVQTPAYASTITCDVINTKTLITPAQLTGNATFNMVADDELMVGSEVEVLFSADGTNRTVTLGANLQGVAVAVNANKIVGCTFVWTGAKFRLTSQIALN